MEKRTSSGEGATGRVIITGGPGVGKTTLLAELAARGHATVAESARAIIRERLARGESPRPDPPAFAREILRRDIETYERSAGAPGWVFFDRGAVEALGMVHEAAPMPEAELRAALAARPFHPLVFILPPWEAIFAQDSERDQTFADVARVHASVARWYGACGYALREVPRMPAADRADFVLRALGGGRGT